MSTYTITYFTKTHVHVGISIPTTGRVPGGRERGTSMGNGDCSEGPVNNMAQPRPRPKREIDRVWLTQLRALIQGKRKKKKMEALEQPSHRVPTGPVLREDADLPSSPRPSPGAGGEARGWAFGQIPLESLTDAQERERKRHERLEIHQGLGAQELLSVLEGSSWPILSMTLGFWKALWAPHLGRLTGEAETLWFERKHCIGNGLINSPA